MRGKFPIPPRSLWHTENGTEVYLGHRGSWIPGQWDELLRELAPWAAEWIETRRRFASSTA